MVTLAHTTNINEFELHFRAAMGFPIPAIHTEHAGCSAVILSPISSNIPLKYNLEEAYKEDKTYIRIFGKPTATIGRRMGVALCYDDVSADINNVRKRTKEVAKKILGTDPYMDK